VKVRLCADTLANHIIHLEKKVIMLSVFSVPFRISVGGFKFEDNEAIHSGSSFPEYYD
jgi:hypothetical protein